MQCRAELEQNRAAEAETWSFQIHMNLCRTESKMRIIKLKSFRLQIHYRIIKLSTKNVFTCMYIIANCKFLKQKCIHMYVHHR